MKALAEDTDAKTERMLVELWRNATAQRKLAMVIDANRTARALVMAGLRKRHPGEDSGRLQRRFADLWLGPDLARKAYAELPSDE